MTIDLDIQINITRDTLTLVDNSTYTPSRGDYRVYVNGYKVNSNNDATNLNIVNDNPGSATSWSCGYAGDGAYKFYYVSIPQYSTGTVYNRYHTVWSGSGVYRSKINTNVGNDVTNTTYWEVINDPASLAANKGEMNESTNIDSLIYLRVPAANGQYWFGNKISVQCECTDCDETLTLQVYNDFARDLDAISIYDSRQEIIRGETLARKIETKYGSN